MKAFHYTNPLRWTVLYMGNFMRFIKRNAGPKTKKIQNYAIKIYREQRRQNRKKFGLLQKMFNRSRNMFFWRYFSVFYIFHWRTKRVVSWLMGFENRFFFSIRLGTQLRNLVARKFNLILTVSLLSSNDFRLLRQFAFTPSHGRNNTNSNIFVTFIVVNVIELNDFSKFTPFEAHFLYGSSYYVSRVHFFFSLFL